MEFDKLRKKIGLYDGYASGAVLVEHEQQQHRERIDSGGGQRSGRRAGNASGRRDDSKAGA